MRLFLIVAQITVVENGGRTMHQIPSFFLSADLQGIRDREHARTIAKVAIGIGRPDNVEYLIDVSEYSITAKQGVDAHRIS